MISRCTKREDKDYQTYSKVRVCKRWFKFENFLTDMGPRHPNTTLDRIDNKRGYTKSNCRWACSSTQANNRRNVIRYLSHTLREWATFTGISYHTLKWRYHNHGNLGL